MPFRYRLLCKKEAAKRITKMHQDATQNEIQNAMQNDAKKWGF